MSINTYIKTWHTRNRFSTFLKLPCKLQSTRSPRLSNGFWWFLVQNEAGILLVSFLCSVSYFCLVQNDENFKRSLELCLPSRVLQTVWKNTSAPWGGWSKVWEMQNSAKIMLGNLLARLQKVILQVHTKFQLPTPKNKIYRVFLISHLQSRIRWLFPRNPVHRSTQIVLVSKQTPDSRILKF